jgi:hypothetical protein
MTTVSAMRELPPYDNFILRSWRGREPLWKVFWIYGLLVYCGFALVFNLLLAVGLPRFFVLAVVAPYQVWQAVSIWRCAPNAAWSGWGYVARALTVVVVAVTILALSARTTLGFPA